jgi:hypothetical protein
MQYHAFAHPVIGDEARQQGDTALDQISES